MKQVPKKLKVVILAGGGGTRLWPVSRCHTPKQLLPFFGTYTLLEKTYARLRKGFKREQIFVSTNIKMQKMIMRQLPEIPAQRFIIEPEKRDTAPAIGLVAAYLHSLDPQAMFVTANVDHYVQKEAAYHQALALAERAVDKNPDHIALLGVNPTYPETGYGYIKMGKPLFQLDHHEIFAVDKFVEKPDLETAREYLKRWEYLWNPALFVWRAETVLNLFKKYLPRHYVILKKIREACGTKQQEKVIKKSFPQMKPISIDYGIIEKAKKMFVLPVDLGWADIGHWRSVKDVLSKNEIDTVTKGKHVGIATTSSLIYGYSKRLIATVGISDLIVVDTQDVLLICHKDQAQDVKKMVDLLKQKKMHSYV